MSVGDDLGALLAREAPADLAGDDVLVVSHKVVSKAEGRLRALASVEPGAQAHAFADAYGKDPRAVQVVLDESAEVLRAERGVLICETRTGLVCANAGVDLSNAPPGQTVLLPVDPDGSARRLREEIAAVRDVRPAVVIADSFGRAWRIGQVDVAIGAAGIEVLDDWRGRQDAEGRDLRATAIAVADALAAAADLVRDKDGGQPAVLARGLERFVCDGHGPGAGALRRPRAEDLFR